MGDAKRRHKINSNKKNRYGLSRDIPLGIKREIRQRCGFGCVVCGSAIYQYEHIDPVFVDAIKHEPSKMALLCGTCHDNVTKEIWSKEKIKRALASPKCLEKGFSFGAFDIGYEHPQIVLGSTTIIDTYNLIEVFGESLLKIEPPEEIGSPFRISASFYDQFGNKIFRIVQNEWQSYANNWDVEITGARITIRHAPKQIIFVLRVEPPNRLIFEKLNMFYRGGRISATEGGELTISSPDGCSLGFKAPKMTMYVGISIHKEGITLTRF